MYRCVVAVGPNEASFSASIQSILLDAGMVFYSSYNVQCMPAVEALSKTFTYLFLMDQARLAYSF